MARDRHIDDRDLTDADRIVLGVYDRSREPIAWDESDDAILSYAREPHAGEGEGGEGAGSPPGGGADNVVPFAPPQRGLLGRVMHSPATGFAMAASLVIGVFAGQGLTPYVDLGVAPGYQDLKAENDRLSRETAAPQLRTRGISVTQATPGSAAPAGQAGGPGLAAVSQALGGFDCANLTAAVSAAGRIRVTGFVSTDRDLRLLGERLAGLDRGIGIVNEARVLGWPICRTLDILIRAGGAGRAPGLLPVVRPYDHGARYTEGQNLVVAAAATTAYDGYIYVDLIQHDGQAVHLLWSADGPGRQVSAGQQVLLGSAGTVFTIAPPFGTDMLTVVSSPVRLFDGKRPQVEKAEGYLKALETALGRAALADSSRPAVSNYHFIETAPAK